MKGGGKKMWKKNGIQNRNSCAGIASRLWKYRTGGRKTGKKWGHYRRESCIQEAEVAKKKTERNSPLITLGINCMGELPW